MPITRTPIIDDSGSGRDGTVIDNAWKQELYNQIDGLSGTSGVWTARAFNAANYSVEAPLTWTPIAAQIHHDRYTYVGNTLFWAFKLADITLGGSAGGYVRIVFPGTRSPRNSTGEFVIVSGYTNGAYSPGAVWVRRMDYSPIQPGAFVAEVVLILEVNP